MKKKSTTVLLALFLGTIGAHRFYLNQRFRGVLHFLMGASGIMVFSFGAPIAFILFPMLIALIDVVVFATMSHQEFDERYNTRKKPFGHRRGHQATSAQRATTISSTTRGLRKDNPFKATGIEKYKDYDFKGAISDFEKALGIQYEDPAVHFNLACAFSITEQNDKALFHLSKAVEFGFVDFDRIHNHQDLAFVRSRDSFDEFVTNGYQLLPALPADSGSFMPSADQDDRFDRLLEEVRALGELKKKGYITDDEFQTEKERILRGD